jgi:hypothetical protein
MNERIRLLALEAGYTKDMFGVGHWDMPECKKFAELIVKECAKQLNDGDLNGMWAKSVLYEHFGVEE